MTTPGRTEAFSDAVIAIAITLLVLELKVPHVEHGLLAVLAAQWPSYVAYVISFVTIGIIWVNHHQLFDRLRHVDRPLLFLNLFFLMTVAVLPFPTALFSDYLLTPREGSVAAAVYCGNMALMGVAFGLMWVYAVQHPWLIARGVAETITMGFRLRFTVGIPIYTLGVVFAFVDPRASLALCAAAAVYYALLLTPGRGRGHPEA